MATGNGDQAAVAEEKSTARRIADPELVAMHDVLASVEGLDIHSKSRVLYWAKNRIDDEMDALHPNERIPAAE